MEAATTRRREERSLPYARIAERVLLWAAVLSAFVAGAVKYVRLNDTVVKAEELEKRVSIVERDQVERRVESNSRWEEILRRLDRIERKVDRRNN